MTSPTHPDNLAFPSDSFGGMTMREYYAGVALGRMAQYAPGDFGCPDDGAHVERAALIARSAVIYADALIAALSDANSQEIA